MDRSVDRDTQPSGLGDFLMAWREEILAAWEDSVARTEKARTLPEPAIRDSVPDILDRLAEIVRSPQPADPALEELPDIHALHRLDLGFRLEDVVAELASLRSTVLAHYQRHIAGRDPQVTFRETARFHAAMDAVIQRSVFAYARARERTLLALDRLSQVAPGDVDAFLPQLMRVLQETTEAIDTVTILLREGDRLRIRATVGLENEIKEGFSLGIGQGFAGRIAATGRPLLLHDAGTDPLPVSEHLKRSGIRALYGVPLIHEGQVMGVAHIGSKSAYDFADEDKQLFRIMTERATSIIVQAQLMEQLQIREARLQRFVDADVVGVFFWEASGAITRANKAFLDMLGRGPEDFESGGIGWRSLTPPEFVDSDETYLARTVEHGSHAPREKEFFHADGRRVPVLIAAAGFPDDPRQGIAFVLDLTSQKRAEAESQRESDFRERLVGIVGHDLRNPLAVMRLGASSLLRQEELPVGAIRTAQRMSASVARMERILRDLLVFTRSGSSQGLDMNAEPGRAGEVASEAIEEVEGARPGADIRLAVAGDDRGVFDSQRLVQLLVNVIDNAIKYGTPGTPVTVTIDGHEQEVIRFSVHNEGSPLPPGSAAVVFDPFQRVSAGADADPGRSLGLGLYIVDQIARAHGGKVEVASAEGQGTTFTVTLPRCGKARHPA